VVRDELKFTAYHRQMMIGRRHIDVPWLDDFAMLGKLNGPRRAAAENLGQRSIALRGRVQDGEDDCL
jgi:hypothetical protein